jgi:acetyl-CoA synthetase
MMYTIIFIKKCLKNVERLPRKTRLPLPARAQQTAFIWEGNEPNTTRTVTYSELHSHVCRLANVLKSHGVQKGDRVTIYMPMVLEAVYAMLACARIGAVHTVVFGGFSPQALAGRIMDCGSSFIISSTIGMRGKKLINFKENIEQAVELADKNDVLVTKILLVKGEKTADVTSFKDDRYMWYDDEISKVDDVCACEVMNAEDPLFLLYTSGSTGKPKGVLHTTGGYLVYASMTHEYVFDYQEGDIYWCTADVGWITGHSYGVYGPLFHSLRGIILRAMARLVMKRGIIGSRVGLMM